MARVFITGSTDGLGLAAAQSMIKDGHDVVVHARSKQRADEAIAVLSKPGPLRSRKSGNRSAAGA